MYDKRALFFSLMALLSEFFNYTQHLGIQVNFTHLELPLEIGIKNIQFFLTSPNSNNDFLIQQNQIRCFSLDKIQYFVALSKEVIVSLVLFCDIWL